MTFQGTNNIQWFQGRPEFYWYHIEENMKVKGGGGERASDVISRNGSGNDNWPAMYLH